MDAKLTVNGVTVSLGFEELEDIIYYVKDCETNKLLFHELAKHPFYEIRKEVASKENLDESTVIQLLKDPSPDVLRELVLMDHCKAIVTTRELHAMIETHNAELITNIVTSLDEFRCDIEPLIEVLVRYPDPSIRQKLAENWGLEECYLNILANDIELAVSETALKSLVELAKYTPLE